jgi:type IV secretory pathway VirB2 component (pilin)
VDSASTTTTSSPNAIIAHVAAHGLGDVGPWLVVLGVIIIGLMAYVEWKRQSRRSRRSS